MPTSIPPSMASIAAISLASRSIKSARRFKSWPRFVGEVSFHVVWKAFLAAATALSMSSL